MHKRISIFGCGVQKGGTTSLYAHFCEHPELSPPSRKEIHFFDDERVDWTAVDYRAIFYTFFSPDDGVSGFASKSPRSTVSGRHRWSAYALTTPTPN